MAVPCTYRRALAFRFHILTRVNDVIMILMSTKKWSANSYDHQTLKVELL